MQQQLSEAASPAIKTRAVRHCDNCGAEMRGVYCHQCGQATRHFIKFFPSVVREILEETFDIDGRFGRTLWAILFRPGRATSDFLIGKRVHYTPVFRLYLFTSVVAFLLLGMEVDTELTTNLENIQVENLAEQGTETGDSQDPSQNADAIPPPVADVSEPVPPETTSEDDQDTEAQQGDDDSDVMFGFSSENRSDSPVVYINSEAWDAEENPIDIGWMPDSVNDFLNQSVANIENNIPRITENPRLLIDKLFQLLPQTMFVLLPIFALVLKFYYLFARRFYMEHLIFSVHIHTFVLMTLILFTVFSRLESIVPDQYAWMLEIPQFVLFVWILIYSFLAQKRVYRQSWWLTLIKYNLVYITYSIIQIVAICIVLLIGVSTL